jgi:5'-nucleotidase (lipoprotein e(P4) family)
MSLLEKSQKKAVRLALVLLFLAPSLIAHAQQANNDYLEAAVLWQQTSGEKRALCYQAFTLARMLLDRDLANRRNKKPRAVIVDVDETVVDNVRYEARTVKDGVRHSSDRFTDWVNRAEGEAVPGAVEFLRYAHSRGVRVFYITNRKQVEKEGTARNLKKLGFPNVNEATVLVRTDKDSSSKEPRRLGVGARHRIVLLMGDNLNDFAEVFETSKTIDSRNEAVERNKAQFGTRFIVLPNPMYGDWEGAIYDYNFGLSDAEKAAKRKGALKGY